MSKTTSLRFLKLLAMVVGVIGIGFMSFAVVMGLSAAVHWVYIYLSPVAVIGVVVGILWFLSRSADKWLQDSPNRDWKQ